MSFLKGNILQNVIVNQIFYSAFSLRTHFQTHFPGNVPVSPKTGKPGCDKKLLKRMSSVISVTREGSLSIEAALIIPIFLFACLSILSFMDILRLQICLDGAMQECAAELSMYGYAAETGAGSFLAKLPLPAEALFSETYVRQRIIKEVGADYLSRSPAKGSRHLLFTGSRIMEKDRIELYCTYDVTPFFALSKKAGFVTQSGAVVRAFTGYDNLSAAPDADTEVYVFITPSGTVYHRSRGCHYLDLSIRQTDPAAVGGLRNKEGGIYYPCERCGKNAGTGVVFVTDYGNRCHKDMLCSGLRRSVETVPLSKVGARSPCSKCGGSR